MICEIRIMQQSYINAKTMHSKVYERDKLTY